MDTWLQIIVSIVCAMIGSTGIWAYIQARHDRKAAKEDKEKASNKMLLGLGHEQIIYLCMKYIERGWITHDEYDDLDKYLYLPYRDMGGNGTAERLMEAVKTLPIKKISYMQQAQNAQANLSESNGE